MDDVAPSAPTGYADALPVGVVVWPYADPERPLEGSVAWINDAAAAMLGHTPQELLGAHVGRLLQPLGATLERACRALLGRTGPIGGGTMPISDGPYATGTATVLPFIAGERRMGVTLTNISEFDRGLTHLRQEVDELRRSNAELKRYPHVLSHDLRTPLRSVMSFLTVFDGHLGDKMDEQAREYMDRIHAAGRRMNQIIEGLLTYAQVVNEMPTFQAVGFQAIVDRVVKALAPDIDTAAAVVITGGLPYGFGDEALLTHVFENLISNAVKFRRSDVAPQIFIEAEHVGGELRVSVSDNGLGVPPDRLAEVFEPYRRLDTGRPGLGLGLALVKRIVDQHGGRVWAEQNPPGGMIIRFTLPDMAAMAAS